MTASMPYQWQTTSPPPQKQVPSSRVGIPPPLQWWPPTPPPLPSPSSPQDPMLSPPFSPFSNVSRLSPTYSPFAQHAQQYHQKYQQPGSSPMFDSSPFLRPFSGDYGLGFGLGSAQEQAQQQPSPAFSPPTLSVFRHSLEQKSVSPLKQHSFLKLPPEVRATIYAELMPEGTSLHVAMDRDSGKLWSYSCHEMSDAEYVGRSWFAMAEWEYRTLGSTAREEGHLACVRVGARSRWLGRDERGLVGFLRSCKAVRDEFAPHLYGNIRFMFDDAATARRFFETADQRMLCRRIKKLSLAYLIPECPIVGGQPQLRIEDWIVVWQYLAMLEGLQKLHVTLVARGAFVNREYQARVMEPMFSLGGKTQRNGVGGQLESFDVVSFEGSRPARLPTGFEHAPFKYGWRAWGKLAGPELERVARRHGQFIDAQPPCWHHLSSYRQHAFIRSEFSMKGVYSAM